LANIGDRLEATDYQGAGEVVKQAQAQRGPVLPLELSQMEAALLLGQRRWDEADQLLRRLLERYPTDARTLYNLALIQKELYNSSVDRSDLRRLREADELCRRARQIAPRSPAGLNIHGVVLKILKNYSAAIEAYQLAVSIEPNNFEAHENLGIVYALRKDLGSAERELRAACQLVPASAAGSIYWRNLAALHFQLGRAADASASIAQALKSNPDDWNCAPVAARIQLSAADAASTLPIILGDLQYADKRAQEKDALVKRMLGFAYLNAASPERAITYARGALQAGDLACVDHLIIAVAEAQAGRAEAARSALEQANEQTWPEDLRGEGGIRVTADRGLLWFETATELRALRSEAETLLVGSPAVEKP
jgi:tetratricopeptide (TPR) repeat protein